VANPLDLELFLFCMALRSDRVRLLIDAVKTLGWPTLAGFARVGHSFGLGYAERFETPLRPRRSALHYLLLLPSAAVSGNGSRKESVPENPGRSAKQISVPADRVRPYAGARAFADQRAEERQCVAHAPGVKAACIAGNAREEEGRIKQPTVLEVRRRHNGGSPLLATAVL
jgi:hypothetical protein